MNNIFTYRDLEAWKRAMDLVEEEQLTLKSDSVGRLLNGLYNSLERKLMANADP